MTTSQIEAEGFVHIDKHYYNEKVSALCNPFFSAVQLYYKKFFDFQFYFSRFGIPRNCFVFLLFTFLAKSAVLAFSLALIFLTGFSYAVLRLYFHAKKPEQLVELRNAFLEECKELPSFSGTCSGTSPRTFKCCLQACLKSLW